MGVRCTGRPMNRVQAVDRVLTELRVAFAPALAEARAVLQIRPARVRRARI